MKICYRSRLIYCSFQWGLTAIVHRFFQTVQSLHKTTHSVVPVTVSKFPAKRLTITPSFIKASKSVFLLVTGADKGHVISKALENPEDVETLPVRLVLNATWILDEDAEIEFNKITHA